MVGVGGRSKGCINCRKRKKGCDLERPECGQCKARGLQCNGYDPDRIFVYQNATSMRYAGSLRKASRITSPSAAASSSLNTINDRSLVLTTGGNHSGPGVLPVSLSRSAFSEKSVEAFLSMYMPQVDLRGTDLAGQHLMKRLPTMASRDEALRLTTLAIGTVALGKQAHDTAIIQQGRRLYSSALLETRQALQDPARARSAAMLVIPQILSIYEILFGADTSNGSQAASWLSHAEGEIALILARGPEAFIKDDSHEIFSNARYRPIIAAIRTRTPSVMNEEAWKTIPWRGRSKTPNDELLDIMAGIPAILERVDKFGAIATEDLSMQTKSLETRAMCWDLHTQLETWILQHHDKVYTPFEDTPEPISDFEDLGVACLTIRYWVTCLLLYSSLDTALQVPPWDNSISHPDRPHPRLFARRIARSAAYFFRADFGITGATSLSFPLGNTLLYFRRNPQLDGRYMALVMQALGDPNLPRAIEQFLDSMRSSFTFHERTLPERNEV